MFHQDPNIEQLMQHTTDLLSQLETYEEFYELLSLEDIGAIPAQTNQEGTKTDDQEGNVNANKAEG